MDESLDTYEERLHFSSEEIIVTDSLEREKLSRELYFLVMSADSNRGKKSIPITPIIDSSMSTHNKRFGLFLIQSGFTRTNGNYVKQALKGVGLGILTLGMVTVVPYKANSTLYVIIVDNENKNVVFYNKSILQDKEPVERKNILKQLDKIFRKYLSEQ